jgi:hypothetical protein
MFSVFQYSDADGGWEILGSADLVDGATGAVEGPAQVSKLFCLLLPRLTFFDSVFN